MGNKKPTNNFKANPERARMAGQKSKKALPPDLKEARLENAAQFETLIYKYFHLSGDELKVKMADKTLPSIDLVVIRILAMAIEKGDFARLNFLLERTIGKVKDQVEIKAKVQHSREDYASMSDQELADKYLKTIQNH